MKLVVESNGDGERRFVLCQWTLAALKIVDGREVCVDGCAHGI